jgi:hypothetical protein
MKQKEWLAKYKLICPVCKSGNIDSAEGQMGPHEYPRVCEDCGVEFDELYKSVGYKITGKSSFYPDPYRDEPSQFELNQMKIKESNG